MCSPQGRKGDVTIKGENGTVFVLLTWNGKTQRITLLEAEKQVKGTIYGSLDLHFAVEKPNGILTFTVDGSQIKRQLTFIPGASTETSLEVDVPVTVAYHDAATLRQPSQAFTGEVSRDGAGMIRVAFSSRVEASVAFQRMLIRDSHNRIWPGPIEGTVT